MIWKYFRHFVKTYRLWQKYGDTGKKSHKWGYNLTGRTTELLLRTKPVCARLVLGKEWKKESWSYSCSDLIIKLSHRGKYRRMQFRTLIHLYNKESAQNWIKEKTSLQHSSPVCKCVQYYLVAVSHNWGRQLCTGHSWAWQAAGACFSMILLMLDTWYKIYTIV